MTQTTQQQETGRGGDLCARRGCVSETLWVRENDHMPRTSAARIQRSLLEAMEDAA